MEYRDIGKTGKRGSIIGLGCEHLDGKPFEQVKETIDAALEHDINLQYLCLVMRSVKTSPKPLARAAVR